MIKEEIKKKIDMEEQDIKFFQRVRMVMSNFNNRDKKQEQEDTSLEDDSLIDQSDDILIQYEDILQDIEKTEKLT